MRLGARHHFSPGWVPTLMVVIGLPVLVALGFWQLDRARQKAELLAAYETLGVATPVALDVRGAPPEQYRRVLVAGDYLADRSLLLDNRTHQGRVGFHVLTPLRIEGDAVVVLVNRGWVAAGQTRDELPVFDTPTGRVEIRGTVYAPTDRQIVLGPEEPHGSSWPRIIERIDFASLERQLGVKLLPYTVRLSAHAPSGFVRDWRPDYGGGPERHRAYAIQWFSFAIILLVVYLAHGLRRDESRGGAPQP